MMTLSTIIFWPLAMINYNQMKSQCNSYRLFGFLFEVEQPTHMNFNHTLVSFNAADLKMWVKKGSLCFIRSKHF
jgi:hypothetical protein